MTNESNNVPIDENLPNPLRRFLHQNTLYEHIHTSGNAAFKYKKNKIYINIRPGTTSATQQCLRSVPRIVRD